MRASVGAPFASTARPTSSTESPTVTVGWLGVTTMRATGAAVAGVAGGCCNASENRNMGMVVEWLVWEAADRPWAG